MQTHHGSYELDDEPSRIDPDVVWDFLSQHAYWNRWRSREDVEKQLDAAWRVVGAYDSETGAQVGFARAMSDGVATAYLDDVFVVEQARGRGLGVALVRAMIDEGPGAEWEWLLHTGDAHDLYRRFGFSEPGGSVMERPGKRPAIDLRGEDGDPDVVDVAAAERSAPPIRSVDLVELEVRLKRLLKDRSRPGQPGASSADDFGAEVAGLDTRVNGFLTAWQATGALDDGQRCELDQSIADLTQLAPLLTRRREVQHVVRLREIGQTLADLAGST